MADQEDIQTTRQRRRDDFLQGRYAPRTLDRYKTNWSHQVKWYRQNNYSHILNDKDELIVARATPILDFLVDQIDTPMNGGKKRGKSFVKNHNAAFKYQLNCRKLTLSAADQNELSTFVSSAMRKFQTAKQHGEMEDFGKEPMPFEVYQWLCCHFIDRGNLFAWSYLVTTWNLMCRTNNTAGLRFVHMRWDNDALVIRLPVTKTNQEGKRQSMNKHCFANALQPELSITLALGVFLAIWEPNNDPGVLFSGNKSQSARFSEDLSAALKTAEGLKVLAAHGLVPKQIGVHSIRKGAASHALSGTTCGPDIASVCNRAEWKLNAVLSAYLHAQNAGDEYLGRILSGLDVNSPNFGILPPHFVTGSIGDDILQRFYPNLPRSAALASIARTCLASVIHHRAWLLHHLPNDHSVKKLPLLNMDMATIDLVKKSLIVGFSSAYVVATGVPPHVRFFERFDRLEKLITSHSNGTLTQDDLKQAMREFAEEFQLFRAQASASADIPAPPVGISHKFMYGGTFHSVPANFVLPKCSLRAAFRLWFKGDMINNYPPFRTFKSDDMPTKLMSKSFSDWRVMMKLLVQLLGEDDQLTRLEPELITDELLNSQFALAHTNLPDVIRKRRTRPDQWSLRNALKVYRPLLSDKPKRKRRRHAVNDAMDIEEPAEVQDPMGV